MRRPGAPPGPAVVMVTGQDPTLGRGGGSSYVRAHARAARQAGFDVHLFCLAPRESVEDTELGSLHRVAPSLALRPARVRWPAPDRGRPVAEWLDSFAHSPYMVGLHASDLAAAVERFLRGRPGPHLIHGFATWGEVGLRVRQALAGPAGRPALVTSVFTTVADEVRAKVAGARDAATGSGRRLLFRAERLWATRVTVRCERRVYRGSQRVLLNYETVRQRFLVRHGPGAPTTRLPYCSDTAFVAEAGAAPPAPPEVTALLPRDRPLIVSVSRHDPRKGVAVLLRGLAAARSAGARFRALLLSGGPLLESHRRLAGSLGLGDVVGFPGWVPDPYPYLCHADLFALPSLQEGGGSIALLEALQAGTAAVASRVDGVPEDVSDGESALLVQPGDPMALGAAIARLVGDPGLRRRLAAEGRRSYERRFSPEALTGALGATYAELGFDPAAEV